MEPRVHYAKVAPHVVQALMVLQSAVRELGIDPLLRELIYVRASQINGCAYCIHLHTRDARDRGESEERLYLLNAWRESPLYSDRERAALAWTEAVTRVADTHVPDEVFQQARAHFTEKELVEITLAVATINALNRLAVSFRNVHPTATTG